MELTTIIELLTVLIGGSGIIGAVADATDEASAIALVNLIKSVLVDSGILKSGS